MSKREAFEMIQATDPGRYRILEDPLRLIDLELRNDPLPVKETRDEKVARIHTEMANK